MSTDKPEYRPRHKRWPYRLAAGVALFFSAIVTLLALLLYLLDTPAGKTRLIASLNDSLAASDIHIDRLSGRLYSDFRLHDVTFGAGSSPWLRIAELRIRWAPRALLSRRLVIFSIDTPEVEWLRLPPRTQSSQDGQGGGDMLRLPDLPLTIAVGAIAVERISVSPDVYGVATTLTLDAAAEINSGTDAMLRLSAETPGTAEDRLILGLRLSDADDLSLRLEIEGAPGGLLAAATRAAPGTGISALIDGHGAFSHWQGDLALAVGGQARLAGSFSCTGSDFGFAGIFTNDGLVPPAFAHLALSELEFDLSMDLSGSEMIPVNLVITSPDTRLAIVHRLRLSDPLLLDIDLDADIHRDDLSPGGGISLDGGRLSGRLSGALDRFEFDLEGLARNVLIAGIKPLEPQFHFKGGLGDGMIRIDSARIAAAPGRIDLGGKAALDLSTFDIEGRLALASLMPLLTDPPLDAAFNFDFSTSQTAGEDAIMIALSGESRSLSGLPSGLQSLIGERIGIRAETKFLPGSRRLADISAGLAAETASLALDGAVDLGQEMLALDFTIALPDLAAALGQVGESRPEGPDFGGSGVLELPGSLKGPFLAPVLRAEAALDSAMVGGIVIREPALSFSLTDPLGQADAIFSLAGISPFGVLSLAASGHSLPEGGIMLPAIEIALGPASFSGDLTLDDDGLLTGSIKGGSEDLSQLPDGLRARPSGRFDLALDLMPRDGEQALVISGQADDLDFPVGPAEALGLQELTISGDIELRGTRPHGVLDVTVSDLSSGFLQIANATLAVKGGSEGLQASALIGGDWRGPLDLAFDLDWSGGKGRDDIRLSGKGTLLGKPLAASDIRIENAPWRLEVKPFGIAIGDGRLEGEAILADEGSRLAAVIESFPLPLVNLFLARPLPAGEIDATLVLSEARAGPVEGHARVELMIADDGSGLFPALPTLVLTGDAELANDRIDLRIEGGTKTDGMRLDGRLALPLSMRLRPFSAEILQSAPLDGELAWLGEIAPVALIFGLDRNRIAGDLRAELHLSGTLEAPDIDGGLSLSKGMFEHLGSGLALRDFGLDARLSDGMIAFSDLKGNDGRGGTLTGKGEIQIGSPLTARIDLELSTLSAVRRDDLIAVLSGGIGLALGPDGPRASGEILADRVEISLDRPFRDEVVSLDVVEIGSIIGTDAEEEVAPYDRPVALDIDLRARRRLFVRGRGLDSEWQADLRLGGNSAAPVLEGEARLLSGRFDFAGFRFTISEGSIIFPGGSRINPLINLTAEERIGDIDVTLRLAGSLAAPSLSLSSSPPLPEDEILARILFGGSSGELSALQALELAQTVSRLRGGGGFDPVGSVRRSLGLDRLDFGLGDNADGARIAGGKYLSDKVYLEIESETATGITTGTLQWSLTRNLSVRGRLGSGRDNSVFLRWSFDY